MLYRRLRLDFLDSAGKGTIRERVHGDSRGETRPNLTDVGFIDERADANLGQIRHLENCRATAKAAGTRSDDLTQCHVLFDHGSDHGGANCRFLKTLEANVERRAIAQHRRLRVGVCHLRLFVLDRGDDPVREKLVGTVLCLLRHSEIDVRRVEIRFRLLIGIARITRVELHQQIACLYQCSGLHRHRHDLPRGFRFYLDDVYRLDHPGRLRRDNNQLAAHELQWNRQRVVFRLRAGEGGETGQREYYSAFQNIS